MKEDLLKTKSVSLPIALAMAAAVGITAGVILSLNMDGVTLVSLCGTENKLSLAGSGQWLNVFLGSFLGIAALILASFILGFSAIGQPAELLIVAFRGLGLGVCVRGVYLSGDVIRSMAAFLPYAILSTGVLMLSAKEAFCLSMRYLNISTTAENRLGLKNEVRDYTARFTVYIILLAALAMADALLMKYIGTVAF